MAELKGLKQTWDLDAFFPGGPESPQYAAYMEQLEKDLAAFSAEVQNPVSGVEAWVKRLNDLQALASRGGYAGAFINCHAAANVNSQAARFLGGKVRQLNSVLGTINTILNDQLLSMSDADWQQLMAAPELAELAWNLNERRERAKDMLPADQEALVNALSVNGYHGWNVLYNSITGRMQIEVEIDGVKETISPGQLQNRLSDPDPKKRAYYMDLWDKAWDEVAETIAVGLNQMAGYRLNLYKARGWDDFLFEPLRYNRMKRETLDSMYAAIQQNLPRLVAFLQRKKELLGLEEFGWQDVDAPISSSTEKISYDEAANFIVDNFRKLFPNMADLAVMAFQDRWIESEDRPGKRMGGFCSGFSEAKQSRIFVTFSGTKGNLSTLAHELGHAYHGWVMKDMPQMTKGYAMNVAETASTFSEVLVGDAAIAAASSPEEKLTLIEDKLKRAVGLMTNLVSRFTFECSFYEERQKGDVSVARLNELMVEAQKAAYGDALDRWHPTFWASKLHFHNTGVPFYNFPYTFGFLFATGVYAHALKAGSGFEDKYAALLMDTGRSQVEDLAMKHLGVDLSKPDFWLQAIDLGLAELDEWLEMTKK